MKTTQVTYAVQRTAERSSEKYAYDKAEVTIVLEEGDTVETAMEAARMQCEAAIIRADDNEFDTKLKVLTSTPKGLAQLRTFLNAVT